LQYRKENESFLNSVYKPMFLIYEVAIRMLEGCF